MKKLNKTIFKIHSWLGLLASLFVLIFFTTGAIIVFNIELEKTEHPNLLTIQQPYSNSLQKPISYDSIYRSVIQQRPDLYHYSFRRLPVKSDETIEMRVFDPHSQKYPLQFVNPYSGKIQGHLYSSIYSFLIQLHYTFLLGRLGEFLAAIFAIALVGSLLTGLYVYRKNVKKVLLGKISFNFKNKHTVSSSLHKILGVWSLLFHFILAFSGAYMMLYALDIKSQFGGVDKNTEPIAPPIIMINIDQAILEAKKQIPNFEFTYLDFPRTPSSRIRVLGNTPGRWWLGSMANLVEFDYNTGKIIKVIKENELSIKEQFDYSLYTLHYGQYGGLTIKILYLLFGISGSILTITGFVLWKKRRKKMFR